MGWICNCREWPCTLRRRLRDLWRPGTPRAEALTTLGAISACLFIITLFVIGLLWLATSL